MVLNRASEIETPDVRQVSKGHGCFENFGVDKVLDKAASPQDLFRLVKPVRSKIICRESFKEHNPSCFALSPFLVRPITNDHYHQ